MRKLIVLPMCLCAYVPMCLFASFQANAVVNGTALNWQNNDYAVRLDSKSLALNGQCTGTVIAGRYVLTAAHCLANRADSENVVTAYGHSQLFNWDNKIVHEDFETTADGFKGEDVALIPLDNPVEHRNIQFIENLNTFSPTNTAVTIAGFGQTHTLNRADFMIDTSQTTLLVPYKLYADQVNESHTIGGDSGSAWIVNNRIIAIHQGSDVTFTGGFSVRETYATNLWYAKNFILNNINGWHYPTVVQVSDTKTIEIQSLHTGTVDLSNLSYTDGSGNVTIDGGTCMAGEVASFEICTLELSSNGGPGTVMLENGQEIQINKTIEVVGGDSGQGGGSGSGGSSGGSMSIMSMLALFGLGFMRNRKKVAVTH